MWDPSDGEAVQNFDLSIQNSSPEKDTNQGQPWLKSIFNTVKRYKKEFFGESDSSTYIKKQRTLDCTIPVNYKFIFAKCDDGFYRPASIMGRSKKLQLFIIYFYHSKKCCYVKPRDLLIRHGNLLDRKVCFCFQGHKKKGKVYGNNSPGNHGFPSIFYIRKYKWYKIPYNDIFLTKKQVNKMYFVTPKRKSSNSIHSKSSLGNKFNL